MSNSIPDGLIFEEKDIIITKIHDDDLEQRIYRLEVWRKRCFNNEAYIKHLRWIRTDDPKDYMYVGDDAQFSATGLKKHIDRTGYEDDLEVLEKYEKGIIDLDECESLIFESKHKVIKDE